MSFINKSVTYSQISVLKQNILSPLLKMYNDHLLNVKLSNKTFDKDINTGLSFDYIIPNNNKKYYLLITKKSYLESDTYNSSNEEFVRRNNNNNNNNNNNYNILYFFPDENTNENTNQNTNETNTIGDFFLEIDNLFNDDFLLEGYLYKGSDNNYEYLLTDILLKNKSILNMSYELRYVVLNELVFSITREKLKALNNHMSINVHPIFTDQNQNLIKVFRHNFIYKNEIHYLERIKDFEKTRFIGIIDKQDSEKYIEIGKYTDVYNVYNKNSNNFEGILYIKGILQSVRMKQIFKTNDCKRILLNCTFNINFKKWQPIFSN
jgi:hypothetical protein